MELLSPTQIQYRDKLLETYFKFWAIILPISSFLLIPSIKGTTPGYVAALLTIPLVMGIKPENSSRFLKGLFITFAFILIHSLTSQTFIMLVQPDIGGVHLIHPTDPTRYFRNTLVTQWLYTLCGILLVLFIWAFYKESWKKYILWGGIFLATYGYYEWIFYAIFQRFGDFLTNRMYDDNLDGELRLAGFQTIYLAGLHLQRLKSLTGEPSMYAFTILPYYIYATHTRQYKISLYFLGSLLLSTSTTGLLGVFIYAILNILRKPRLWPVGIVTGLVGWGLYSINTVQEFIQFTILDKMSSASGQGRSQSFANHLDFIQNSPWSVKLFGLGFGYARSTDGLTTLLINLGIPAFIGAMFLAVYPIFKLDNSNESQAIKYALAVILTTMFISVPEFGYLGTWLFFGLAYAKIRESNEKIACNKLSYLPYPRP